MRNQEQPCRAWKIVHHFLFRLLLFSFFADAQGIQEFRGAIDKLLTDEGPETFGLHTNADLTYRSLKMKEIMSIIQLATKGSRLAGISGLTREASLDGLAKSYLEKLPPMFEPEVTRKALNKLPGGYMSPLNVHLRQEIERLNRLLQLVGDALETLRLALAGSIALG